MSPQVAPRWRVEDEIKFRRDTVREMLGQGYSQAEIARHLEKGMATISRDVVYLREQARKDYERHIQERLPFEVETTLALYKSIIRQATELAKYTDNDNVKIRALVCMKDARKEYQDLQLRGEYVERAMKAAGVIQKQLSKLPQQQTNEEEIEELEELEQELEGREDIISTATTEDDQRKF
jgi:IS30 family transposase